MKFNRKVFQSLAMISQFGFNMLVPILFCSLLGSFLDKKLGTDFLVILLFFVGALAGFVSVYRFARGIYTKDSENSAYLHKGRKNRSKKDEGENHKDKQDSV